MADAFADMNKQDDIADLSHAEWLGLLVEREIATRRFQTPMRSAKLRHIGAVIEGFDFRTPRKLGRTQFQQLATGRWITDARNLMITGPCGVGKTWPACALGQRACRDNRQQDRSERSENQTAPGCHMPHAKIRLTGTAPLPKS